MATNTRTRKYPKSIRISTDHHYMLQRYAMKKNREMADVAAEAFQAFFVPSKKTVRK